MKTSILCAALLTGGLAAGCDIFLPDDWGTLGSPCDEDRHCQDGLWCYERNCVGDSAVCNNGIVELGEQCDGGAVGVSCQDLGLQEGAGGYVSCVNCKYDTSRCGAPIGACTPGMNECTAPALCVSFLADLGTGWSQTDRCARACNLDDDCKPGEVCTLTLPTSDPGVGWACLLEQVTRGYGHRCLTDSDCDHGQECIIMNTLAARKACARRCTFDAPQSSGCEDFMPPGECVDHGVRDFCGAPEWIQD